MNASVPDLVVAVATPADAVGMVTVIHAAFGARPPLDPPSTAGQETPDSVAAAVGELTGIYATVDDQPAGALILADSGPGIAGYQRVSVHPDYQRHGIASAMVRAAEDLAAELGFVEVELLAREEIPDLITVWQHLGYVVRRPAPHGLILGRRLPVALEIPTTAAMQQLGAKLAELLGPGDVIIAAGELGAGKTTLTQGIGAGLGSSSPVISPTFVLSRIHRSGAGRPDLVHVDAYRLGSAAELDDLDLDASLSGSVTVIEWGTGLAEDLSSDRLDIDILRPSATEDRRTVIIRGVGDRWAGVDLDHLREGS